MKKVWIGNIVLPNGLLKNGQITVEDGQIVYVGKQQTNEDLDQGQCVEWKEGYIWPGLLDIHVHGAGGADVMDGNDAALSTIAATLIQYGVTGFLATTVTGEKDHLSKVMSTVKSWKRTQGKAEILGIHLEGPWICPAYKGAQNPEYIQFPKEGDGKWAYQASDGALKIVTLAPENEGAEHVIRELVERGVIVSIGHTNATYAEVEKAVELGASHITHTYNAMSGFHHREPGVVGAALALDNVYTEVIVDGYHVHPKAVDVLIKTKGTAKVLLISDGIRAIDMPEGEYDLGGLRVATHAGKATLADGTLAGSLLTLNIAIMNTVRFTNTPIWEAVNMASLIPAKRLGVAHEIGSIEVGKRANMVAVKENGMVQQVWIDGIEQYSR